MFNRRTRIWSTALIASALAAVYAGAAAAASLTVNPPSISADYAGQLTLTIGGVPAGSTAVVEKYVDANGNGVVDGGDTLIQSFPVTDGQAFSIGGVRDTSVPGDEDGVADGQIRAIVNAQVQAELATASGDFLYRLSSAAGGFTPVTVPFTVTPAAFSQGVAGQVTSNGSPVPAAAVVLFKPNGGGLSVAFTDSSGLFTINAAPGTYQLLPLATGFVFDPDTSPEVTIIAGQITTQDLTLEGTDRSISGRVVDASSGAGIPGVQLLPEFDDQPPATAVFTDANGNFTMPISALSNQWRLYASASGCSMLGYVRPPGQTVDVTAGNVSGVTIALTKVNALFYGSLRDNLNTPLSGVQIRAKVPHENGDPVAAAPTDTNGNYVVGVTGGTWDIGPSSDDPALAGYLVSSQTREVSNGQALRVDFVAEGACVHVRGHVIDNTSAPVSDVSVIACTGPGSCPSAVTASDGSFDLGVGAGTWQLFISNDDLASRGLVGEQLSVMVTCGQDQNNLTLRVLNAAAQITGAVTSNGNPVASLGVYAYANINGINYNVNTDTDTGGHYALPVANGSWHVGLDCTDLRSRGLPCPSDQPANISGQNRVVDFMLQGAAVCSGDCDGGGNVTVNEIILLVNIALGSADPPACAHGIPSGAAVNVTLIIQAVNHALNAC